MTKAMDRARIALGCAGAVLFALLTAAVIADASWVRAFDEAVQQAVFPLRSPEATAALTAVTDLSDTVPSVIAAVAFCLYLAWRRGWRRAGLFAGCVLMGEGTITVVKMLVARVRPLGLNVVDFPSDASFPSGHVFAALCIVSFLLHIVVQEHPHWPKAAHGALAAAALLWPLIIAFTRIYLGVHWPTDVLGSFLLGGAVYLPFATLAWDRMAEALRKPQS